MSLGLKPLSTLTLSGYPLDLSKADVSPFSKLLAQSDPSLVFLVILTPYSPSNLYNYSSNFSGPMGAGPMGSSPRRSLIGGPKVLYLSDKGYQTLPSDPTLPNINFMPRLSSAYNMQLRLFNGAEPKGRSAPGFGSIVIRNDDGELNDWHSYFWDGAQVEVKCGTPGFAYGDFATVLRGRVQQMTHDDSQIELAIWDRQTVFQKPLYLGTYQGVGGLEGGADLTGKVKPLALGLIRAVEPVLVDSTNFVYQFHGGSMEAVLRLMDGGNVLPCDGDVSDVYSWSPVAGHYVTCLSKGIVRLGAKPVFALLGDIQGDNTGGYVHTVAGAIRRVVTQFLYPLDRLADPDELDLTKFAEVDAQYPHSVGYYTTAAVQAGQILDDLMNSILGWWTFTRDSKLSIGVLQIPTTPVATITDRDVVQGQMRLQATLPPAWRRTVNYKPIGRVLSDTEMANGSISDADRALLKQAVRSVVALSSKATTGHYMPRDEVTDTFFDDVTAAQFFLNAAIALYSDEHRIYSIPVKRALFKYFLGTKINVQLASNSYLRNKNAVVLGITEDAVSEDTVLEIWV